MELRLTLALPHDASSVPVARNVLARSLDALGVAPEVVGDIEVALTEACTNVLNHVTAADDYEVLASLVEDLCVIEIVDRGMGFDSATRGLREADRDAEGGRGIQLMRALVDSVTFTSRPQAGTVVHLEKRLSWDVGARGATAHDVEQAQPEPV